jgi:OmpA-OmpF porin, OOP family
MKPSLYKIAIAILAIGLCTPFAAAGGQDAEGSKDHPLISRYPGSAIYDYFETEFDEFTLPLSKLADDKFSKTQKLEGKITRIAYTTPEGRSPLEVFRNYQGALKQAGFQTLYSCAPQDCAGEGGMTANLYGTGKYGEYWGPDHGIRYLSAKLARPEGDAYVSLQVDDQGGNGLGRVLLYVIEVKPMESGLITVNAASLANDINRTGHASVYGIYFDTGKADVRPESEATLKEIGKLLQENPSFKLYVVGHTDNQGGLEMNMGLSERRAQAVLAALTTKYGVAAPRLKAFGAGPYSPVASNKSEEGRAKNRRVELVEQ